MADGNYVVYSLTVNGYTVTQHVVDVEVREGYGLHDIVILSLQVPSGLSTPNNISTWDQNSAISMLYGTSGTKPAMWYGYVNHSEFVTEGSGGGILMVRYILIGTSKVLNDDQTRSWKNVSPSYIARKLAAEHGMRAVVNAYPQKTTYDAQAGESDFEFLNRMADKIGWKFRVSGGTLYFQSPNILFYGSSSNAVPGFNMDRNGYTTDTVVNFKLLKGDNIPGSVNGQQQVNALDAKSGKALTAKSGTGTTIIDRQYTSSSQAQANNVLSGKVNNNKYWLNASATLYGNQAVHPGTLINLGGNAMIDGYSGLWLVTCVRHYMSAAVNGKGPDVYTMDVEIMRNTATDVTFDKTQQINPEFVTCHLDPNNLWISDSMVAIIDGQKS